jgi:hypothetical protein
MAPQVGLELYNPPVNSPVRCCDFKNLTAQMTTQEHEESQGNEE